MAFIDDGESGLSVRQSLNRQIPYAFNPIGYGADNTGVADASTAIQAAIDAAAVDGGWVFIPGGTYKVNTGLICPLNVSIFGAGRRGTILKAGAAITIIKYIGVIPLSLPTHKDVDTPHLAENLFLDGNGVGLIGLHIDETQFWDVRLVTAQNFVDAGFEFKRAVSGGGEYLRSMENGTGFRFRNGVSTIYGPGFDLPPNHVTLHRCIAFHNSYRGVDYVGGRGLTLDHCGVESNGTDGDEDAGGVYIEANSSTPGGYGSVIRSGWIEANYGGYQIKYADADNAVQSVLRHMLDTSFVYNNGSTATTHLIHVGGSGTGTNYLHLNMVTGGGTGVSDIYRDGASSVVDDPTDDQFRCDDLVMSGTGSGTVVFEDLFTGVNGTALASHTPNTGGAWTDHAAGFQIQGNQLSFTNTTADSSNDMGAADGTYEFTANMPNGADFVIQFRRAANDSLWYWIIEDVGGASQAVLQKYVAGAPTTVSTNGVTFAASTNTLIQVVLSGNSKALKINGVTIHTDGDSTHNTATRHGIASGAGATGGIVDTMTFTT